MKSHLLLSLGAAGVLLTSCAHVYVVETQTAAVVTERPKAIYIQPFSIGGAEFVGHHAGGPGERPIRESLAPAEFSSDLQEELEKLAPCRVLLPGEIAPTGWLVEGSIEKVDAGNPGLRALPGGAEGRSHIRIHVRVIDVGARYVAADSKDSSSLRRHGRVIYEFDVAGGSGWSGHRGSITAPGLGYATPFDYRNAADRIRAALEPDANRFGHRVTSEIRDH